MSKFNPGDFVIRKADKPAPELGARLHEVERVFGGYLALRGVGGGWWFEDNFTLYASARPSNEPRISAPTPEPKGKGLKFDGGKPAWSLLMRGCGAALAGVVAVLTFGAKKYAEDSWQEVENAETRYRDALYRHLHAIETHGNLAKDPETGLLEWFHVACNALFLATFAAKSAKAQAEKETH